MRCRTRGGGRSRSGRAGWDTAHPPGIALGVAVGLWRVRRAGASVPEFMDAGAPALLVAQSIGRVGNWFNQELFGRPTSLPWGLEIARDHRPEAPRSPRFTRRF